MTTERPSPPAGRRPPVPAPTDRLAYQLAVGALGLALVAFLIGAAVIAADGKPVPSQYWAAGSGIAGAIIGIVAPTPTRKHGPTDTTTRTRTFLSEIVAALVDVWKNRGVLLLLLVFVPSVVLAAVNNSAPFESVAAASGGALVGLLAPPPGQLQ